MHVDSNMLTRKMLAETETDAGETGSPEEATVSTSQDITSHKAERRKPRSASADRILETGDIRCEGAVSALGGAASPGGLRADSGPWTSWGHERRRHWRRSLSGSQSLSHVGHTPLSVHR